jgi:hypothetical protein
MAPGRPAVHPDQIGLLIVSLAALAGGLYAAFRLLF